MSLIEIKNLKKYFEIGKGQFVHAVDDISLEIRENEILGLVGESGSGKSTLGKVISGLHPKTSGDILYKGKSLPAKYKASDFLTLSKDIQMIFQDPYGSLNPRMTVEEVVGEGLKLRGVSKKEISEKVATWLTKVGMSPDHMSRFPHEFSGGQRQRIGIARAMIVEPTFVICDEPISALDVSVQAQVVNLLEELKNSMGLTLLFIAHDLSMVRYISDRIVVMYLGSVVECGPANDVYFEPKHPYSQLLIKSNPLADPKSEKSREHTPIKGEIPSPVNVPAGCRFAGRCPSVMDKCRSVTPILKTEAEDHQVACHLFE
ncbi:MAG: ATP-binding cassette domain-containing protein [Lentisphaeraceae bacterium]|nr:ATP-binding cassette domain-containing protein [Lentisphaeraceae bacterium]